MDRVLIIDDEEDICFLLSGLLKAMNYTVEYALDLQSGMEKARAHNPGTVLLDVNLPDGNGIDALPLFRHALPDSRIILMSAHMLEQEKSLLKARGADDFLSKPISTDMIQKVLSKQEKL
jgi:two-component system, OmpR family, response regulator